jgi:hypothetical protein
MALIEAVLKANLASLFDSMNEVPMSNEDYAANLAKIINDHIKTAQVDPGIAVDTPAGKGATSSPGKLS